MKNHVAITTSTFALVCAMASFVVAGEPTYSLDELAHHPYRFLPTYGHASQNPGSPKYFEPGYGYRIPGFGFRAGYNATLNSYPAYYNVGRRNPALYNDTNHRFWTNVYGGPWYHPGFPANTRTAWPDW